MTEVGDAATSERGRSRSGRSGMRVLSGEGELKRSIVLGSRVLKGIR
jgi:hypothetical protein